MKRAKKKYAAKSRQYIVIADGLVIDKEFLSTLGIKSATGYCENGQCTALLNTAKKIKIHVFKAKLSLYAQNSPISFPCFPEYDGILACSGTNERLSFDGCLKLIRRFDKSSPRYFLFKRSRDDLDEDPPTSLSQKKKTKKRCRCRFKHMIMRYNVAGSGDKSPYAAQLLPIISNNTIFGTLEIIQMQTATLQANEDADVFATLFTLENKRAKHALAECVADYNRWYPEAQIEIVGDILGSFKSIQGLEKNKSENKMFGDILAAMRNKERAMANEDRYCLWNRYVGWISEKAIGRRRLADVVVIYREPEATAIPFFINENGRLRAFYHGAAGVNISDLRTAHAGGGFYISKMRIISETNVEALLNHVRKYMDQGARHAKEASFTAEIPPTMGLTITKCGIRVPGDSEYAAALEFLSSK